MKKSEVSIQPKWIVASHRPTWGTPKQKNGHLLSNSHYNNHRTYALPLEVPLIRGI